MKRQDFNDRLIKDYSKSENINLNILKFSLDRTKDDVLNTTSIYLSTSGIVFYSNQNYELNQLLKIYIKIPGYWDIKKNMVKYFFVNNPDKFHVLVRVEKLEKLFEDKIIVSSKIVSIDNIDKKVLEYYLENSDKN